METDPTKTLTRLSRGKVVLAVVAGLLLLGVLVVSCVPTGGGLRVQLTTLQTWSTQGYSASASGNAPLRMKRVVVVALGEHPLMGWATPLVVEELEGVASIEAVGLVEAESLREAAGALPQGGSLPDLFVVLRLQEVKVDGFALTGRDVEATVAFRIGQELWASSVSAHDEHAPPGLRLNVEGTLEHSSTTTGYESADARFQVAGTDLGKQLAVKIAEVLQENGEKHGVDRAVPAGFRPSYEAVPATLPLPTAAEAVLTRMVTGSGVLTPNQTTWLADAKDPVATVARLQEALQDAGWQVADPVSRDADRPAHVRAQRGPELCEAFQRRDPRNRSTLDAPIGELVILYTRRLDSTQTRALFPDFAGSTLTELETFAPFFRRMSKAQRRSFQERLVERIDLGEPVSAETAWWLARTLHATGKSEEALRAASRAWWLFRVADRRDRQEGVEKAVGGWLGDAGENWRPAALDEAEAASMGFPEIGPGRSVEAALPLGVSLVVYVPGDATGQGPTLVSATVLPGEGAERPHSLTLAETAAGFQSRQALRFGPDAAPEDFSAGQVSTDAGGFRVLAIVKNRSERDGDGMGSPTFLVVLRAE